MGTAFPLAVTALYCRWPHWVRRDWTFSAVMGLFGVFLAALGATYAASQTALARRASEASAEQTRIALKSLESARVTYAFTPILTRLEMSDDRNINDPVPAYVTTATIKNVGRQGVTVLGIEGADAFISHDVLNPGAPESHPFGVRPGEAVIFRVWQWTEPASSWPELLLSDGTQVGPESGAPQAATPSPLLNAYANLPRLPREWHTQYMRTAVTFRDDAGKIWS